VYITTFVIFVAWYSVDSDDMFDGFVGLLQSSNEGAEQNSGSEPGEHDYVFCERLHAATSPVNHRLDARVHSQYQRVGGLVAGDPQQQSSGVSTCDVVDSRCESVPNACQSVPTSTASAEESDGQWVDSDVVSHTDGVTTLCEVGYQTVVNSHYRNRNPLDQQSPTAVTSDTTFDQHSAGISPPAADENTAENCDWQFFAARQVDPHLLFDILLARKHRDRDAREFLLSLPASVLKKYEVFSRQHPIFICLDIVK